MPVPLFDPRTPLVPLQGDLRAATERVLDSGTFILGPEVEAFEREFADYLGARHAIGVANGTEALTLALRALGVGPGDEVVVPSFTFYASAEAIPPTGARPVFCDVDRETFCVTQETVREAITPRTKAVIVVHLFGNVAPVAEIEALGVPVLEDAAQAAGSIAADGRRAGALGTISTFSFFPSKNLGAFGDGGAVVTSDPELDERVRMLRFHGSRDKETFELVGHNSRLDQLQAGALGGLLPPPAPGGARPPAPAPRPVVRRPPRRGRRVRGGRARRGRRAAGPVPRYAPGVAPVRGPSPGGRRARRRAQGRRGRKQGLLPRADPPAARDAAVRGRRGAPGHRRARAHASRDPHEPGAQPRAGRRGDRGRPRRFRQ